MMPLSLVTVVDRQQVVGTPTGVIGIGSPPAIA